MRRPPGNPEPGPFGPGIELIVRVGFLIAIVVPLVVANLLRLSLWLGFAIAILGAGVVAATWNRTGTGVVVLRVRLAGMLILCVGLGLLLITLMRQFHIGQ